MNELTTDNLNDSGNHLRQHADIRNEPEAVPQMSYRLRQLDVSDEHILELLAGIGDLILSRKRMGLPAGLAALEMQGALNAMVAS